MGHRDRPRRGAHVLADLQAAADVGRRHPVGAGGGEVGGLDLAQFGGFRGLHQVVDAGAAAAHARLHRFAQLDVGDGGQQGAGLIADALAVEHVAGIVIGQLQRLLGAGGAAIGVGQGLEACLEAIAEAHLGQEFLDVAHLAGEGRTPLGPGRLAGQDGAIGLHGVAAARRGHQHRIQGFRAGGFALAQHRFQAVD